MKILIIGAGILGASLAFHLSRAGAEVTVIEAATPATAASGRSFGWINASFYANPAHHHLRVQAMTAHHRLQSHVPTAVPNWQGALWWEDVGQEFDRLHADLRELGYHAAALSQAEITALEPDLKHPPLRALRFPSEGAVDPVALTKALLTASGATLHAGLAAKTLLMAGDSVIGATTATGPILADHTLVAAGVATPSLLNTIGLDLPMLTRPGLILRTKPVGFRLRHILVTPDQEIRQTSDGSLLAPCAPNHQADTSETVADGSAAATLAALRGLFDAPIEAGETLLGYRPVPADTLPVLGQVQAGLNVAVMHSGVTLAAFAGEALSAEIMGQGVHPLWQPYRPERLLTQL
ncbi:MAG: NAD(P)/FAD-dependent oxidoreductase [Cypionkella sp.]